MHNWITHHKRSTKSITILKRINGELGRELTRTLASYFCCIGLVVGCVLFVSPQSSQTCEDTPPEVKASPVQLTAREREIVPLPSYEPLKFTEEDIQVCAQVLYGEAKDCSQEEQMLVIWCICNRVDDPRFPNTVTGVATQPGQFHGYSSSNPVLPRLYEVAQKVLELWNLDAEALVHLPYATSSDYLYFNGDGYHNWFRKEC